MTSRRNLLIYSTLCAAALGAGVYGGVRRMQSSGGGEARPGDDASRSLFAATLPDLSGVDQPLARWRGRPLVVNFWATWCAPCIAEMPDFQSVRNEVAAQGVEFLGIGIDNAKAIGEFAQRLGISYPLFVGSSGGTELARAMGNDAGALPYTVVLDRAGHVRGSKLGRLPGAELRKMIAQTLE